MIHALRRGRSRGATLIEVLVAILILSFGALALGGMMAFAIQQPKLASYRAAATNLASGHIERIRANPSAFANGDYAGTLSYDGSFNAISTPRVTCTFPCSSAELAAVDVDIVNRATRSELPAGGALMTCEPSPCQPNSTGNMWVMWQEPTSNAAIDARKSDNCPTEVTGKFTNPAPRCVYVRFRP